MASKQYQKDTFSKLSILKLQVRFLFLQKKSLSKHVSSEHVATVCTEP